MGREYKMRIKRVNTKRIREPGARPHLEEREQIEALQMGTAHAPGGQGDAEMRQRAPQRHGERVAAHNVVPERRELHNYCCVSKSVVGGDNGRIRGGGGGRGCVKMSEEQTAWQCGQLEKRCDYGCNEAEEM